MNFTREPIVETVITPKEGFKLVVRNSKGGGQEEFFVDAVEVISFGSSSFFRSLEKPKCFLVPVNDYEILEVREARMVLKTTSLEKGVKIGGGREAPKSREKESEIPSPPPLIEGEESLEAADQKMDKKRDRRRFRKKKGKLESEVETGDEEQSPETQQPVREFKPSLIPPPSTLISETLGRRRESGYEEKEKESENEEHSLDPSQEEPSEDEHIPF